VRHPSRTDPRLWPICKTCVDRQSAVPHDDLRRLSLTLLDRSGLLSLEKHSSGRDDSGSEVPTTTSSTEPVAQHPGCPVCMSFYCTTED